MKAANDFICKVPCQWGPNAFANQVKGPRAQLPAGSYDPPYRINNENSQVAFYQAEYCRMLQACRRLARLPQSLREARRGRTPFLSQHGAGC